MSEELENKVTEPVENTPSESPETQLRSLSLPPKQRLNRPPNP
jgi:hypothetical protein